MEDHHVAGRSKRSRHDSRTGKRPSRRVKRFPIRLAEEDLSRTPEGSPLLARAGCIRGYIDTNDYLIRKFVLADPEFYECWMLS